MSGRVLHLRCPLELAGSSVRGAASPHEHVAVDIRLPVELATLAALLELLGKCDCPCGESLVLASGEGTP